ncbi:MAG: hypothetical protein AVDCRST_MAG45-1246, partial [uncultured Solirubrobacterales bacterium]
AGHEALAARPVVSRCRDERRPHAR